MRISSHQNPKFKLAMSLREKRDRTKHNLFSVEGLNENRFAVVGGYKPNSFFIPTSELDKGVKEFLAQHPNVPVFELEDFLFNKLAVRELRGQVIGLFNIQDLPLDEVKLSKNPLILVADGVEKPGNLGAILRSCDAFDIDAIFVTGLGVDLFSPNVVRASLGGLFLKQVLTATPEQVVDFCKRRNLEIYLALPHAEEVYNMNKGKPPCALVERDEPEGV